MSKKLILERPVKLAEGQLSVIELRRPTVADILVISKLEESSEYEKDVALAARLSGRPQEDLEKLDIKDFNLVQEALAGFFE